MVVGERSKGSYGEVGGYGGGLGRPPTKKEQSELIEAGVRRGYKAETLAVVRQQWLKGHGVG